MATWSRVKTVAGAQEVLRSLRPHYRIMVATNADLSGTNLVRAALARVGLNELVDDVVSSRDVGAAKPDAFFFRAALLRAGHAGLPLDPSRAVMVGNSSPNNVVGAKKAHLRAVWLNPVRAQLHGRTPAPDAEIRALSELPAALAGLGGPADCAPRGAAAHTITAVVLPAATQPPAHTEEAP